MRKGYVVTWDALVALMIILFLMLGFIGLHYFSYRPRSVTTFQSLHSVGENALDTINKMGVLEEIGYYWATGNTTYAANLSRRHLDPLIPRYVGYRLEAVEKGEVKVIYDSGNTRPGENDARDQTRAFRLLSGYSEDASRISWVARSWLVEEYGLDSDMVYNATASGSLMGYNTLRLYDVFNTTFYFIVPGASSLSYAWFNISWAEGSTTTSTTSTSTTTTTTSAPGACSSCPGSGCPIPEWYSTKGDNYNYHEFIIPAGEVCNLEVVIYTGIENNFAGTNLYDLYANWNENCGAPCAVDNNACLCKCQRPPSQPDTWLWDCKALNFGTQYVSCLATLTAGTYQVMVDCWSPEGGPDWCPGSYYIYIRSYAGSTVGCPDYVTPSTVTTTTSTSTTSTTTTVPGLPNGDACTDNANCSSGSCASDYDSLGMWCAPAGNCVHSAIATCDSACYGYGSVDYAPDCKTPTSRWRCNIGDWSGEDCPSCSGPDIKDALCAGTWQCQAGAPAACTNGCTTNSIECDYCGSTTAGTPGSDTWYDATCTNGVCGPGTQNDCPLCRSCLITDYAGSCDQTGVNDYYEWPDSVDPDRCDGAYWCNATGDCELRPITECSKAPREIFYQAGVCFDPNNCDDDGDEEGNTARLSFEDYMVGETYLGGWDSSMGENEWMYENRDDDDVSIGDTGNAVPSGYIHHNSSFIFEADVGDVEEIEFRLYAMPEGNCTQNITLKRNADFIGTCLIGNPLGIGGCAPSGSPRDIDQSTWQECYINGTAALNGGVITKMAENNFTVEYYSPISGFCTIGDRPCAMFIDSIGIDCG